MVGIFANIEDILMTNTKIHSDFEDLQRKSDFVVECIGDVLMRHLSIIEQIDDHRSSIAGMEESVLAYLRYCSNQMASSRLLQQKRGELRKFSEFLKVGG